MEGLPDEALSARRLFRIRLRDSDGPDGQGGCHKGQRVDHKRNRRREQLHQNSPNPWSGYF